jgi:hypothetical protein
MPDADDGVPVELLIGQVKQAITFAGVSQENDARDLRISSVQLILEVIATTAEDVGLSFRVPFIGTELSVRAKRTHQDTHTIRCPRSSPSPRRFVVAVKRTAHASSGDPHHPPDRGERSGRQ